jgi:hypothetical protein
VQGERPTSNAQRPTSNGTREGNGYEHEIRLDGITGFVSHVQDEGRLITVTGWTTEHWNWKDGDRVLLVPKGEKGTRYRIAKVRHCGDPHDMYFLDCVFDPRSGPTKGGV